MENKKSNDVTFLSIYMDYNSRYKESPRPIYIFDKDNIFEKMFYHEYINISENIENSIFTVFFNNTLKALSKSYRYEEFDSQNKLLSFYYILFEIFTTNRDYILYLNDFDKNLNNTFSFLNNFKKHFIQHAANLGLRTLKIEHINSNKSIKKGIWEEFISVFDFWLDDNSFQFEKTAVYIHEFINKNQNIKNDFVSENITEINKLMYK